MSAQTAFFFFFFRVFVACVNPHLCQFVTQKEMSVTFVLDIIYNLYGSWSVWVYCKLSAHYLMLEQRGTRFENN